LWLVVLRLVQFEQGEDISDLKAEFFKHRGGLRKQDPGADARRTTIPDFSDDGGHLRYRWEHPMVCEQQLHGGGIAGPRGDPQDAAVEKRLRGTPQR
jgi:hypothetical protein